MAPGYHVGGYASGHPVMLPMIDVVEVGAGGGSIAFGSTTWGRSMGRRARARIPARCAIAAAPSPPPMPT